MDIEFGMGTFDLQAALDATERDFAREAGAALREEAEIEMTEAKRRTPVLTGALRASGHVTGPTAAADGVEVKLAFGGPAAPYALAVHENMEAFHANGEAKFLERTLNESVPHMAGRLARRIAARMAGRREQ